MDNTTHREIWVVVKIPRADIFFLRYTLDAYEGLAVLTTIPGGEGLVRIYTEESQRGELEAVIEGLKEEIDLEVIEWGVW